MEESCVSNMCYVSKKPALSILSVAGCYVRVCNTCARCVPMWSPLLQKFYTCLLYCLPAFREILKIERAHIAPKYTCSELDILTFVVLFYFLIALYKKDFWANSIALYFQRYSDTFILRNRNYATYKIWNIFDVLSLICLSINKILLPVPALAVWLSVCAGLFPLYKPLFTFSLFSASCCHSF